MPCVHAAALCRPRMLPRLCDLDPSGRIFIQHLHQKVHLNPCATSAARRPTRRPALRVQDRSREGGGVFSNTSLQLLRIAATERPIAVYHHEQRTAQRPHIGPLAAVGFADQRLGGEERGCPG